MIQKQPQRVIITTPKGQVVVARRLYDRLEARMVPDDLGLLRCHEWWVQLSDLIIGIQIVKPDQQRRSLV